MGRQLTIKEVTEIQALKATGLTSRQISIKTGLNRHTVKTKCKGIIPLLKAFTEEQVSDIVESRKNKVRYKDIAAKYNCSIGRIEYTLKKAEAAQAAFEHEKSYYY